MEEPPGGHAAADADQVTRFTAETIAAREARAGAWILLAVGISCILFGGIFFAANHSGQNVVATVTHQGPCSNGTCTVDVVYSADGRQVAAVMYGVPSGEVYGSPWPRLNITYQPGSETDPTTNDMPDGIWIGFLAAGVVFVGWGAWLRLRRKRPQEELRVAPAGAAVTAALTPAVADQPVRDGPARISGRGPRWVADTSGVITIAERYPRWSAVIFTPLLAILPGLMVTQNSQSWLPRGHLLAAVAYLVIAAAVSIWGVPGLGGSGCGSAKTPPRCVITFALTGSAGRRCAVSRTDR